MFNFTAEELRRTTEIWPAYKGSKMKKRRGLGQRRKRHVNVKIKHLMNFESVKVKHPNFWSEEA